MNAGVQLGGTKNVVKVILVGDATVGKTSLVRKYTDEKFQKSYLATLGVDFSTKKIRLDDKIVEIQLWDIAGQKNYEALQRKFLKTSHGALLVYDITNNKTFENLVNRLKQIMEMNKDNAPEFIIIGNKLDLQEPTRDPVQINDYFTQQAIKLDQPLESMLTSAKNGKNVQNVFKRIAQKIIDAEKYQQNKIVSN